MDVEPPVFVAWRNDGGECFAQALINTLSSLFIC